MTLRNYKTEDAHIICQWIKTEEDVYKWSADIYNKFPLTGNDIDSNYAPLMAEKRFIPLTAVDDSGDVVGHFIIRYPQINNDEFVRFGFVIVDPARRGKGLGSKMLRLGIEYAKNQLNARRIDLGVFANNDSARHCYEAVGFKEYGRHSFNLVIGEWECIDMELFI